MARIRTVKPELPSDQRLARCSVAARFAFVALITQADDYGLVPAAPRQLLGSLFPNDDDITIGEVGGWLNELNAAGLVAWRWRVDGGPVVQLVGWEKHQRVDNRRKPVLLNELDEHRDDSPIFAASRGEPPQKSARTSDLRPPISDLRPPTPLTDSASAAPVAGEGLALVPAANAPRPRTTTATAAYPNFPVTTCQAMYGLWTGTFGAVDYARFRKTFGPLFTLPEPDRRSDDELLAALKSYADLAPMGDGARFASVTRAAECLSAIATVRRDHADDPSTRTDAIMRIIHGRRIA